MLEKLKNAIYGAGDIEKYVYDWTRLGKQM